MAAFEMIYMKHYRTGIWHRMRYTDYQSKIKDHDWTVVFTTITQDTSLVKGEVQPVSGLQIAACKIAE